jgi:hypothetical protein
MSQVVQRAVSAASTADRSARSLWNASLALCVMEIQRVANGFEGQKTECRTKKAGERATKQSVERHCNNRGF